MWHNVLNPDIGPFKTEQSMLPHFGECNAAGARTVGDQSPLQARAAVEWKEREREMSVVEDQIVRVCRE